MIDDYPIGAMATYADGNATVTGDDVVLVTGPINGEPIFESERVWVPVWSPRDNGREATTVFVSAENLVNVEPARGAGTDKASHAGGNEEKGK